MFPRGKTSQVNAYIKTNATLFGLALITTLTAGKTIAQPIAAEGYSIKEIVAGSEFCGVHGLGIDSEDKLYAGSVVGQRLYSVDINTGKASVFAGPPKGMADDMEFLSDGTLVWTSISQNAVRAKSPNGEIRDLAAPLVSVNSIALRESDERLFVAQVFGGDGLWELDTLGVKPPRNILKNIGGLNGFDIGPDGMIYGPLWFKKQVVKIDPDTGELTVIAEGFHTPAAANFDSKWNLYVLDTGTGEVILVDYKTGEKSLFVQLKTSLDNLAIDSKDRLYISNMADNSIVRIDSATKKISTIVKGGLSCPNMLSAAGNFGQTPESDDSIYVADIFALRKINGKTGEVTDLSRAHDKDATSGYTSVVAGGQNYFYTISNGAIQTLDRKTNRVIGSWQGIRGIQNLVELADGDLLVLHGRGSQLSRLSKDDFDKNTNIQHSLKNIAGLAVTADDVLYLTAANSNSIHQINLRDGDNKVFAENLAQPHSIALSSEGELAVIENGNQQLRLINTKTKDSTVIATDIPLGRFGDGASSESLGLAAGKDGNLYLLSDKENSIYRVTKP